MCVSDTDFLEVAQNTDLWQICRTGRLQVFIYI